MRAIGMNRASACWSMLLSSGGAGADEKAKKPTPALQELIEDFVDTIYDSFNLSGKTELVFDDVHAAVQRQQISDVWEVFGRTLVSRI